MNQSNSQHVTELVLFKLKEGVDKNIFLKAANEVNHVLETEIPGYIHRSLEHSNDEDEWVDIVRWESMNCALDAIKIIEGKSVFQSFVSMIETKSAKMLHLIPTKL